MSLSQSCPERFDHFMARALHDPCHGYYAKNIRAIGRRGDFTTAPMMDNLLARAIANWVENRLREEHCRNLIEIGPGEGLLSKQVMSFLPWSLRWKIRLHLVEQSFPLSRQQRRLLGCRASWHRAPADALAACGGHAIIFSNELVDAFPVRRFRFAQDGWQEMFVQANPGKPSSFLWLASSFPLPDSSVFLQDDFAPGQEVEVHESYHQWLSGWLPSWQRGSMLSIDYGDEVQPLYRRRPGGSIRAYWMHHCLTGQDILLRPGKQDLTADVNFTDLIRWTGCPASLCRLSDFIQHHVPDAAVSHPLADPFGPGGAFLVLDQRISTLAPARCPT